MIGGDGIGPEVISEAVGVLDAAGFAGSFVEAGAGWDLWVQTGESLPVATVDLVDRHRLCLFGAITSRPSADADAAASRLGIGTWTSPILELRRRFGLDISLRPAVSFPGNPGNAARRSGDGGFFEPPVDLVVVRQNTEGLYSGVEWTDPPPAVRAALASHPRWTVPDRERVAVTARVVTARASVHLMDVAFSLAKQRGETEVVLAEKPNVLRATSGLVVEVARETAKSHPGVRVVEMTVDAVLMEMVARPDRFGVIATSNLFGDLLSDAAAGLVGGPGFAPSSNLGERVAVFEPVHGSAPDIAGTATANPIAAILAAAMLADHSGQFDVGTRIRRAVAAAIAAGLADSTSEISRRVRDHL